MPTHYSSMHPTAGLDSSVCASINPSIVVCLTNILTDSDFGRSPPQLDIAHSVTDRPLEHLSDETLRLLVENARQLKEGSGGVVVDGEGQIVTE